MKKYFLHALDNHTFGVFSGYSESESGPKLDFKLRECASGRYLNLFEAAEETVKVMRRRRRLEKSLRFEVLVDLGEGIIPYALPSPTDEPVPRPVAKP